MKSFISRTCLTLGGTYNTYEFRASHAVGFRIQFTNLVSVAPIINIDSDRK